MIKDEDQWIDLLVEFDYTFVCLRFLPVDRTAQCKEHRDSMIEACGAFPDLPSLDLNEGLT